MKNTKVVVLDRGEYTTCTVNLQGATVTSWRVDNVEQLFVSRQAHSLEFSTIRGGIHLVFPHLGVWNFGPKHGFTRNMPWVLEEGPEVTPDGDVFAVFTLRNNSYTKSLWNYTFKLCYKVTLCKNALRFRISVENIGKYIPFEFHMMQHSWFRVPDVSKCEILGLRSCLFSDVTRPEGDLLLEDKDAVVISKSTDKTYRDVNGVVTVTNTAKCGVLALWYCRPTDLNIWNPGPEHAAQIPDLGDGEYRNFISFKYGAITDPIQLEPLTTWTTTYTFEVNEPKKEKKLVKEFYDFFAGFC